MPVDRDNSVMSCHDTFAAADKSGQWVRIRSWSHDFLVSEELNLYQIPRYAVRPQSRHMYVCGAARVMLS
jgi:hypothetical protein